MQLIALATSLFAIATASHAGHDHSALKPSGPFYGILTAMNKAGDKNWNNIEIQFDFSDATFDMVWWFGIKHPLITIPKQTFRCERIAYTFDEVNLNVVVNPDTNACLTRINGLFRRGMGIANPFAMPVQHDTGDLIFAIANNVIVVEMYAIDAPLTQIPSGVEGQAPASLPARRSIAAPASPAMPDAPAPAGVPAAPVAQGERATVAPAQAGPAVKDGATTTTGNSASRIGSVFVSAAAVIFAGLFL